MQVEQAPNKAPNMSVKEINRFEEVIVNFDNEDIIKEKYTTLDGFKHGKYTKYFKNGTIHIATSYFNNVLHGDYVKNFEDGSIREKCHYVHGKLHGAYIKNIKPTVPQEKCYYVQGKLQGKYETYWPNGVINYTCDYSNGEKVQYSSVTFRPDGTVLLHEKLPSCSIC